MSAEASLWKWLRDGCKGKGLRLSLHRVENLVGEGFPDVEGYLYRGFHQHAQFWIELKSVDRPARVTTCPLRGKVREKQGPWLEARWALGGNAWMLIQVGSAHEARRYLIPGGRAGEVEGSTEWQLHQMAVNSLEADARFAPVCVVEYAAFHRRRG